MVLKNLNYLYIPPVIFFLSLYACPSFASIQGLEGKIALLPFDNLSKNNKALINIMPILKSRLEEKGLEVVDWDSLSSFICEKRVRSTGHVSKDLARVIGQRFMVNTILVGSILNYFEGENPMVGLSARLIDSSSGSILWADYTSATGDDFVKILGLGKIKTIQPLILKVVDRLLVSISSPVPYKEIESTYSIAVMPFQNNTKGRDVGRGITYLFLSELFKNDEFIPVEYGNIRQSIVENRIIYKGELDYQNIEDLSATLGVDVILVGTVETYSDGKETNSPPLVSINARLLDAHRNKILWYNTYRLDGEDGIIVFDWGRIRSVDKVAHTVVTRLVNSMKTTRWFSISGALN
jgi:TolB-like protein